MVGIKMRVRSCEKRCAAMKSRYLNRDRASLRSGRPFAKVARIWRMVTTRLLRFPRTRHAYTTNRQDVSQGSASSSILDVASYRLSRHARVIMAAILERSEREFSAAARDRYAALLLRAMRDVAEDPTRPGAVRDSIIDATARFYHIRHSRTRVTAPPGRVGNPRHEFVYDVADDGVVEIITIIPDPVPRQIAMAQLLNRRR